MTSRTVDVPLAVVGCDFRVASAAWRSALVLSDEERQALADNLAHAASLKSFAVVNTCNRTEWIVESPHPAWAAELLRSWMLHRFRSDGPGGDLPSPFVFLGADAVRHFVRVSLGLESFVPGEREIAGQCTRALLAAHADHLASPLLDELAKSTGRAARRLERLGRFRDSGRGVHSIATDMLAAWLKEAGIDDLAGARVGVAGLGVMGRKVVTLLEARGARVTGFNRTVRAGSSCRPLTALGAELPSLDALVVTTGALTPPVRLEPQPGRARPLVVLDLGVPAQATAPPAAEGVRLLGLDDLRLASEARPDADDVVLAEQVSEAAVMEVVLASARRRSAQVIRAAQAKRDELRDERLPRVLEDHVADLPPARRRKLEAALRALMTEQHEAFIDEVGRPGPGASGHHADDAHETGDVQAAAP